MSFIGLMEKYNSSSNTFKQLGQVEFPEYPVIWVTEVDKENDFIQYIKIYDDQQ